MMSTPFIEGRCYFTPESIVELCADSVDEVMVGYNLSLSPGYIHMSYAWVPRYVVAALIFGEGE